MNEGILKPLDIVNTRTLGEIIKKEKNMYQYNNEALIIINNYLETIPNEDSKVFYRNRLNKFFEEFMSQKHNLTRPLNAINFHDINSFIEELPYSNAEKLNYYYAFAGFFKFAYRTDKLLVDVMKGVDRPTVGVKPKKYIDKEDIAKIKSFIRNSSKPMEDKLLLGLYLYTGLSRKYIANLTNYQFSHGNRYTSIFFDLGERTQSIPLNNALIDIVRDYFNTFSVINPYEKVFKLDENYMSAKVSSLSKKITGKAYTPTDYSNTFIKEALSKDKDILTVSCLTLETITTILKHVLIDEQEAVERQINILQCLFEEDDNLI
jgi:site-specific recombinase XerD